MSSLQGLYYPFGIVRGETFAFSFEFCIDGVVQFFDEYEFEGQLKDATNSVIATANLTFAENETSSDLIDVSISAEDTNKINAEEHLYEIRCKNIETGVVRTLFYGTFSIKQSLITNGTMSSLHFPR